MHQRCGNPNAPTPELLVDFMADMLYDDDASISALNTARSAVATILPEPKELSAHPLIKRFMRGAFNMKPTFPKYFSVWDPSIVIAHLRSLKAPSEQTLKQLTYSVTMLVALLSAQRVQTLSCIDIDHMEINQEKIVITINSRLKQSRHGRHLKPIVLKEYPDCRRVCVVTLLKEYIARTQSLRRTSRLLISHARPHKQVTPSTISRWLKDTLRAAGITGHTGHSTRSASTSKANLSSVPIDTILEAAGWSQQSTFAQHYNKLPVRNFGEDLLNACMTPLSHDG